MSTSCNTIRNQWLSILETPVRYEGVASPYLQAIPTKNRPPTQQELDMRRKAEILQYNKNNNSKLTNKQKYTQIVSAVRTRRGARDASNNLFISDCPNDLYIPTPSSSSDVPGPVVMLYYDPAIPLYKYADNTSINGEVIYPTQPWSYSIANDILTYTKTYTNNETVITYNEMTDLLRIAIIKPNDTTIRLSMTIPVGVRVVGTANTTVALSAINVEIAYNKVPLSIVEPTISVVTSPITITKTGSSFEATRYLGTIAITDLRLPAYAGYIFTVRLKPTITSSNSTAYAILNMTTPSTATGCVVTPTAPTLYEQFSITETTP
jgi:hypothetical protein